MRAKPSLETWDGLFTTPLCGEVPTLPVLGEGADGLEATGDGDGLAGDGLAGDGLVGVALVTAFACVVFDPVIGFLATGAPRTGVLAGVALVTGVL